MKVSVARKIVTVTLGLAIFMVSAGTVSDAYGQDGNPDVFIPDRSESTLDEELAAEQEFNAFGDEYYGEQQIYYNEAAIVEEDTSTVSMLTFNFLFYIVYKLKFSNGEQTEEDVEKTADD